MAEIKWAESAHHLPIEDFSPNPRNPKKHTKKQLEHIRNSILHFGLFNACALADLHYHTCQSELFRRHVCSTYKAANVVDAFDRLKAMINSSTEQAEKKGE